MRHSGRSTPLARPPSPRPDEAGVVIVEMAAAIGLLALLLIGSTEVALLMTQKRKAELAHYVAGDLVSSHVGGFTCAQFRDYVAAAIAVYRAGNLGASTGSANGAEAETEVGTPEFRFRLAGVKVRREDGVLHARTAWTAEADLASDYALGADVVLPPEMMIEGQFYVLLDGRTYLRSPFHFFSTSDGYFTVLANERVFVPRHQSSLMLSGPQDARCAYDNAI
ncbi:MAG: hypothetical protein KDG89_04065 [Geminicoccaceae bacterium]|nr:hypothetical protein [Geminicoccaceae bacterium]